MAIQTTLLPTRRHGAVDHIARARLEAELAEATALLDRLLEAEDRIGLVFPVMDDARRFLAARARRRRDGIRD
jgi:hypothetical protein